VEAEEPASPDAPSVVEHSVATDPYTLTTAEAEAEAAPEHALPADAATAHDVPEATLQDHAQR
jgi:hypothetical protein